MNFSESASTLRLEIFYTSVKVLTFSPREKLHFNFFKSNSIKESVI